MDHMRNLFKKRYGTTPNQYRTTLRMLKARRLLAGTTMNVSEVARQVGYSDVAHFSRLFRKQHGQTPAALVRECTERPVRKESGSRDET